MRAGGHVLAGHGVVLALVIVSIALQLLVTGSSFTRLVTIALQAATLVAAVWTAGARRRLVRLAAQAAVLAVVAAGVLWVLHGSVPPGPAGLVNGLLVAVAPAALAASLVRSLRSEGTVTVRTVAGMLLTGFTVGLVVTA